MLLPAGIITIPTTWVLPAKTRLIGEGPNSTIITANGSVTGDMIDMGSTSVCTKNDCPEVIVEHLGLVGNGTGSSNANGIVNCCAQELSHVEDVSISNVQVGLWLNNVDSQNSGPYTGLTISNVYTCLVIGGTGLVNSRGVHGLKCANSLNPKAAITIDGPNNTLEDISLSSTTGQTDGILIGFSDSAQGNVLTNIQGSGFTNVIELSGSSTLPGASTNNCPNSNISGSYNVCDITILGVTSSGGTTILDDLTGATVSDTNVAMYVLGEPVQNGAITSPTNIGYSRFTTATLTGNAPTWLVGTNGPLAPSGCVLGSLYSCTSTSCPTSPTTGITEALWECKLLSAGARWKAIQ